MIRHAGTMLLAVRYSVQLMLPETVGAIFERIGTVM